MNYLLLRRLLDWKKSQISHRKKDCWICHTWKYIFTEFCYRTCMREICLRVSHACCIETRFSIYRISLLRIELRVTSLWITTYPIYMEDYKQTSLRYLLNKSRSQAMNISYLINQSDQNSQPWTLYRQSLPCHNKSCLKVKLFPAKLSISEGTMSLLNSSSSKVVLLTDGRTNGQIYNKFTFQPFEKKSWKRSWG